ncbi:uncharacterized protein E0L32_011859 [Thyridium curvatum]|uniref:Tf2-1-like SH3-like domain-containing protein n=1 Tax=Thyridium curvatum TaxID=1093900 RepID=A0A507BMS3_9PEZI|nr:uncharacterized protein E0L32_011859 [Thyridium curvatum]TPX18040.1 hypothetical protein E0L32_011859 [Thyridium curvatum]
MLYTHSARRCRTLLHAPPFAPLYGREAKNFLVPTPEHGEFGLQQQNLRDEAAYKVQLAQTRMKIYYDDQHSKLQDISVGDFVYVKLAKPGDRGYHLNNQTKLSFRKTGPFKVLEKAGPLAYKIQLPPWLKWNPVISVSHLHPAKDDTFQRPQPTPGAITKDGIKKFTIDDIEAHQVTAKSPGERKTMHCKVKWLGYEERTWEPEEELQRMFQGCWSSTREKLTNPLQGIFRQHSCNTGAILSRSKYWSGTW